MLCLVGLDYFSTAAYLPTIARESAGRLAPFAALLLGFITLALAVPIYAYVARRSPLGQGTASLVERTIAGWPGKLLIVALLGFAATHFVITRTLSAADAAEHVLANPRWQAPLDRIAHRAFVEAILPGPRWVWLHGLWGRQLLVTLLLSILSFAFWAVFRNGFTRRIVQLAVVVVATYLSLAAVVIGAALWRLGSNPDIVASWWEAVRAGQWEVASRPSPGWSDLFARSLQAFPPMALGLCGFELAMLVMPLLGTGNETETGAHSSRVRSTRRLLWSAAGVFCLLLALATTATTLLIPAGAALPPGRAAHRTLAYLAHGEPLVDGASLGPLFGPGFGVVFDLATIIILCLAGASVTIGLRDLVPQFLFRFGMELEWAHNVGAILHCFNLINLLVTLVFRASVAAQQGAYSASVLVLASAAACAAAIDASRSACAARNGTGDGTSHSDLAALAGQRLRSNAKAAYFALAGLVFFAGALASVIANPSGLAIASSFVALTLVSSLVSRMLRCTEPRFSGFDFSDESSQRIWRELTTGGCRVLVPHRPGGRSLEAKEAEIRQWHRLGGNETVVFIEAHLGDASDFFQRPLLSIAPEDGRVVIRIWRCASIAHVLAAVALELGRGTKSAGTTPRPLEIHFGWSDENPVAANINFLFFGQGNVPWMVRELVRKSLANPDQMPKIIIG